jgi:hypothetical protein
VGWKGIESGIIGVDKNVTTGNMWTIQHGMIEPLGMTLGW